MGRSVRLWVSTRVSEKKPTWQHIRTAEWTGQLHKRSRQVTNGVPEEKPSAFRAK